MATSTLERKSNSEKDVYLDWPIKRWTFSHVDNIEYAINQLRSYSKDIKNPVLGYYLIRGWGTRDMYHRIIPQDEAERLSKEDRSFTYKTLEDLMNKLKRIEEGVYTIENGLITGKNPNYRKIITK